MESTCELAWDDVSCWASCYSRDDIVFLSVGNIDSARSLPFLFWRFQCKDSCGAWAPLVSVLDLRLYFRSRLMYYRYFLCIHVFCLLFKGVDIRHNKDRKVHRKEPKSQDIYLRLLVKVTYIYVLYFTHWNKTNSRHSYSCHLITVTSQLLFLPGMAFLTLLLGSYSCTGSWPVAQMLLSTRSSWGGSSWAGATGHPSPSPAWSVLTSLSSCPPLLNPFGWSY